MWQRQQRESLSCLPPDPATWLSRSIAIQRGEAALRLWSAVWESNAVRAHDFCHVQDISQSRPARPTRAEARALAKAVPGGRLRNRADICGSSFVLCRARSDASSAGNGAAEAWAAQQETPEIRG